MTSKPPIQLTLRTSRKQSVRVAMIDRTAFARALFAGLGVTCPDEKCDSLGLTELTDGYLLWATYEPFEEDGA